MQERDNRLGWSSRRRHVHRPKGRRSQAAGPKLLHAVWEALNVARDNKALLLTQQDTIVNLNERAAELCRRSFDDVKGRSINDLLEDGPPSAAIGRWQTGLKTAGGVPIAVEVTRQPLSAGLQDIQVFAIRDLRERHAAAEQREQLNARLAEQHERLDAALENMLQGLAMFDAEQRLIVCNQRYADMYGLTADQVKPGTTVRQILEYRISNGFYHVSDTESFVDSWIGNFGEVSSRIQQLADGRIICVTRRSMANGGRLVTHEDVTERQKLHERLEQQHKLLEAQEGKLRLQNLQLEAALDNMVQGLAMFDSEQRLVVCNRRYAEIYELSPEQVKLGTTLQEIIEHRVGNGLHSEKSSQEIVDSMLRGSDDSNFGQFHNQLSDGRCVAITVQRMANGGTVTTHHDITEQRRSEAKIAHMAVHDTLTGLPNRVLLNEQLEQALKRAKRGEIVATHVLDLDHFKHVNDTLGHPVGDKLLQMVASRIRGLLRETDTVARMGGDEFAIVQIAISEPTDATVLARRIIAVVSEAYDIDGHQVVIGASIGIAVGPSDGVDADEIMRNADLALYRAKGDGRGAFRFFEPEMDAQMQARRALECDLRKALLAREFELYYQPLVDLATDKISGFEALIRWHHPQRGMIAPGTFIPLAEETGMIVPLGEWAIRQACATAAPWPDNLKIAVNLSPAQFRSPGLLQAIVGALAANGPGPWTAGARDHGDHPAAGQRGYARHPLPAARARRADRHG